MIIEPKALPEVLLIKPNINYDGRGHFLETYQNKRYGFLKNSFVQDNLSVSVKYTVRGLHWQEDPMEQGKLVSCVSGSIFDVAVDIRPESDTYGKWVYAFLNSANHHQFWIPAGFAHGFQALDDNTVVSYKCTSLWSRDYERSLLWSDSKVNIEWPYPRKAILSEKDSIAPPLER